MQERRLFRVGIGDLTVFLVILAPGSMLTGCANWGGERGVSNRWRDESLPAWTPGTTTESDVTAALGPPSQIIGLEEQTVFYYVREQKKGSSLTLIIWNQSNEKIRYDRAAFFFDKNGILTAYSYSPEALPHAKKGS